MAKQFLTQTGLVNAVAAIAEWVKGLINSVKTTFGTKTQAGMVRLGSGLKQTNATTGEINVDTDIIAERSWVETMLSQHSIFKLVTSGELPADGPDPGDENKIHIVRDTTKSGSPTSKKMDLYSEWVWTLDPSVAQVEGMPAVNFAWEKIGSFSASDLSAHIQEYTPSKADILALLNA